MIQGMEQEFEGGQSQMTANMVRRLVPANELTRTRAGGRGEAYPVKLPGQLPGRRIFVQDGSAGIEEGDGWQVVIRRMT